MDGVDWDDLRLLLEVSRRGSFLRAGADVGLAASTVSRRISALESRIGTTLLERGVDGCRLTARGEAMVGVAESFGRELDRELAQSRRNAELSGAVSISAGDGFVAFISAAVARFLERHPECSVEFAVDIGFAKVAKGEADIAIRTAQLNEPSLIYRRLGAAAYGLYCAPGLAPRIRDLSEPRLVDCVALLPPLDQTPQARAARAAGFVNERVRVSTITAQLQAVREGLGAAPLPRALAQDLVAVFDDVAIPDMDIFLVTRPSAAKQPHIRACIDEIVATHASAAASGVD